MLCVMSSYASCFISGVMSKTRAEIQKAYRQMKKKRKEKLMQKGKVKGPWNTTLQLPSTVRRMQRLEENTFVNGPRLTDWGRRKPNKLSEVTSGESSKFSNKDAVTSSTLDTEIPSTSSPLIVKIPFTMQTSGEKKDRKQVMWEAARLKLQLKEAQTDSERWRRKY